ncbi:MAG: PTS sugar transporter [Levilactobacillus sp.]|jgi:phosphotransferase system HPr-like phosphotransfer protein|uniref:PTS sugar transporter n=1 Tax=Levilactobacillus suantsaiihabitans TaxID=2487722 RepID=A0A4Z0JDE2_9LACO|nr:MULTISPECIES: PTS sugar transporter [Levilactobacillus]MCH4123603.1 PTS sugar transporter [Levilactobacillus sp.]MCI1553702.1 PTS sugar transporter [Levilactobacillus sp.]MCI1599171.1 PTS sugar transporter [Levilactobacillus sp.]MCI1606294.1 PTS sugar transporter [Levilactobacillus sp.]TGD20253.1 PTS sugar transporter [Levilactobacillus suantsaiihabitans]
MKTIGFPLYQETPTLQDDGAALQRICQRYSGTATIRVNANVELNPRLAQEVAQLSQYGGDFVQVVADGPDEAQLAAAIHQQLAKDKYCY